MPLAARAVRGPGGRGDFASKAAAARVMCGCAARAELLWCGMAATRSFSACTVLLAAVLSARGERIIGGTSAGGFLRSHMGHLTVVYNDSAYGLCSASIIAPLFLLTSAHCVWRGGSGGGSATLSSFATLGQPRSPGLARPSHAFDIARIWRHAAFVGGWDHRNDIAVVQLARKWHGNTVTLADNTLERTGTTSVAGYGQGGDGRLMRAAKTVRGFTECVEHEQPAWRRWLSEQAMLCATGVGWPLQAATDTCYGDSGGPLYVTNNGSIVQLGITSWASAGCAQKGAVAWYTRVATYKHAVDRLVRHGVDRLWTRVA